MNDVPILMYHHVCPEPRATSHFPYAVTPELFEEQVAWLARKSFTGVHLSSLVGSEISRDQRPVVITFDDGARNVVEYAIPILKKYRMTATVFIPPAFLGTWNSWDADLPYPREELMTEAELKQLHQDGFEIGSHGARHINLDQSPPDIALDEMRNSRIRIETLLNAPINVMAYPFGAYPKEYKDLCMTSGYVAACSISSHSKSVLDEPFALRRILISPRDRGWRFKIKTSSFYLRRLSRAHRKPSQSL